MVKFIIKKDDSTFPVEVANNFKVKVILTTIEASKKHKADAHELHLNGQPLAIERRISELNLQDGTELVLSPKATAAAVPPPPPLNLIPNHDPTSAPRPPQPPVTPPRAPPVLPNVTPVMLSEEERRVQYLVKCILVKIDGKLLTERTKDISIQPLIQISNAKPNVVKNIKVFLKKKSDGAPFPGAQQTKEGDNVLFRLTEDNYLDYDQEYTLEIRSKPNAQLRGDPPRATFKFTTAPLVSLTQDTENGLLRIPYADVRLWTNNFDHTSVNVEHRATGVLGNGSFGEVFKGLATQMTFQGAVESTLPMEDVPVVRVAVKRLKMAPQYNINVKELQETMIREVSVLGDPAFIHPNIVKLYGYVTNPLLGKQAANNESSPTAAATSNDNSPVNFHHDSNLEKLKIYPCLVYEYLPLGSLDGVLASDRKSRLMTWKVRLLMAIGIARGLNHMHTARPGEPACHRDLKAANIAVDVDYTPKLIDCGLARFHPQSGGGIRSAMGRIMGSPVYLCPVYHQVGGEYSVLCDIYSFGIVLMELISGKLQGRTAPNATSVTLFNALSEAQLLNDREYIDTRCGIWPPEVARGMKSIAFKCMKAIPADRYQSMREVLQALQLLEQRHVVIDYGEQESENRIAELQDEVGTLARVRDVRERMEMMKAKHVQMHDLSRMKKCCDKDCQLEYVLEDQGIVCSVISSHFYCDACFQSFVQAQLQDKSKLEDNEYKISCPQCLLREVSTPYDLKTIAQHTSPETYEEVLRVREDAKVNVATLRGESALEELREEAILAQQAAVHAVAAEKDAHYTRQIQTILTKQLEQAAAEALRRQIEAERLAAEAKRKEDTIRLHKARIENDILKLHCPHCGKVITEDAALLEKCMAWTHKGTCGRNLCGLCLKAFPDSRTCHDHVLQGCSGNGTYWVRGEEARNVIRADRFRRRKLEEYLATIPDATMRNEIKVRLASSLRRLKLV